MQNQITHLDLANAQRDEANEIYRLGNRIDELANYVGQCKSTIISIKEARICKSKDSQVMSPYNVVQHLAKNSAYEIAAIGNTKLFTTEGIPAYLPFHLAQLFNPKAVAVVNAHTFRYPELFGSPTSKPHMGTAFLAVEYAPLINGVPDTKLSFIVSTHHLPLFEDQKEKVCNWLVENELAKLDAVFGNINSKPIIRLGDFNTFKDKKESVLQQALLQKNGFVHVSTDKYALGDENNKIYGTFYPFPHDQTPIPIALPTENENYSELDHVFFRPPENRLLDNYKYKCFVDLSVMCTDTKIALTDHLPITILFENF